MGLGLQPYLYRVLCDGGGEILFSGSFTYLSFFCLYMVLFGTIFVGFSDVNEPSFLFCLFAGVILSVFSPTLVLSFRSSLSFISNSSPVLFFHIFLIIFNLILQLFISSY